MTAPTKDFMGTATKVFTGHVRLWTCVHSWTRVQILPCPMKTFTRHKPFPNPFIALNIDGSVQGNPRFAVGRGVLQDSLGNWINGFSMPIGFVTNNPAELWVARQGLLIA